MPQSWPCGLGCGVLSGVFRIMSKRHVGLCAAVLSAWGSWAAPSGARPRSVARLESRHIAMSVGSPTDGRLVGGAHLEAGPFVRFVPSYASGDVRWGLDALVGLIQRAAKTVHAKYPDAVLSVGHLSKPGGGELDRHASHESGRDADLGFYVRSSDGKAVFADHFVPFSADGRALTWPGAQFDDARNWALVASLVGDGRARVTYIFVAAPLRTRLLAYAQKIGVPAYLRNRAAERMMQPRGALPHDDHFHVRIGCPEGMAQCIEQPVAKHRRHSTDGLAASHGEKQPPLATPRRDATKAEAHPPADDVPNLSEPVRGLDSAVIPAPLEIPRDDRERNGIDDPDGILEQR